MLLLHAQADLALKKVEALREENAALKSKLAVVATQVATQATTQVDSKLSANPKRKLGRGNTNHLALSAIGGAPAEAVSKSVARALNHRHGMEAQVKTLTDTVQQLATELRALQAWRAAQEGGYQAVRVPAEVMVPIDGISETALASNASVLVGVDRQPSPPPPPVSVSASAEDASSVSLGLVWPSPSFAVKSNRLQWL